jgi:hypothetical protein
VGGGLRLRSVDRRCLIATKGGGVGEGECASVLRLSVAGVFSCSECSASLEAERERERAFSTDERADDATELSRDFE